MNPLHQKISFWLNLGKKRQNKKYVKFSLESSKLKQDQVKLGMLSKKGRKPSDAFSSKNVKSKKKS
jgi:hypothetical protein